MFVFSCLVFQIKDYYTLKASFFKTDMLFIWKNLKGIWVLFAIFLIIVDHFITAGLA